MPESDRPEIRYFIPKDLSMTIQIVEVWSKLLVSNVVGAEGNDVTRGTHTHTHTISNHLLATILISDVKDSEELLTAYTKTFH